jgi:hypothetical protein
VADINVSYGQVLRTIGVTPPGEITDGRGFLIEAANIAGAIPVSVHVTGDRNNRVRDAFARIFAEQGFRSGGVNTLYRLDAELMLTNVGSTSPATVFVRYEINANFIDSETSTVLVPYNINGREGHRNEEEAINRALVIVERRINEEYSRLLSDYLFRLMP